MQTVLRLVANSLQNRVNSKFHFHENLLKIVATSDEILA